MFVIKYKKIFIAISCALVALSIFSIVFFGLKPGIDFTGGSSLKLNYTNVRPQISLIEEKISALGFDGSIVQSSGDKGVSIKTRDLTDTERLTLIEASTIDGKFPATQESFTSIGPSVGKELKNKAIISVVLVFIAIIFFVAYAFRGVSKPISSWKYGFAVILTLLHDVIIPAGAFALFGYLFGAEVDTLFIVALLTTFALSISDTIVVFDRIRENLTPKEGDNKKEMRPFAQIVGGSLSQTFVRSMNTSLLVLMMVICLAIFGPESTRLFAVVLAIGMFVGTYSSIFLASPLLVLMERLQKTKKQVE